MRRPSVMVTFGCVVLTIYVAFGADCSCGLPQVEATLPVSSDRDVLVRLTMVAPRMAQAMAVR